MRVIEQGDKVQVHYVKVFQDGSTVSSRGKAPTEVTVGTDHPRLPGLGLTLVGLTVGESRTLIVPPQDAYRPFNPRLIRRIARWRFAEHEDLSVGQMGAGLGPSAPPPPGPYRGNRREHGDR